MYATAKREMQFCAGPGTYTFSACQHHIIDLASGEFNSNFMPIVGKPMYYVSTLDEESCDLCREGGELLGEDCINT